MLNPPLTWLGESFYYPWALCALPLAALVWLRGRPGARRATLRYSDLESIAAAGRTWAVPGRMLPPALRTLALILLVICAARPRLGNQQTRIRSEGVAIQLVVDRSSSMEALDFQIGERQVNRLDAVKRVVRDFVLGVDELPGRPDDLIGLIVFARFADSRSPLTLSHEFLVKTLQETETAETQNEDGTAIGDALALGVERLRALEERRGLGEDEKIKSKIVILLTDGQRTAGDIDPDQAAEIAKTMGIKVYTIGVGSNGMAMIPAMDPFGRRTMRMGMAQIDEETLREIASITGGLYFRATDTESLQKVYAEIDALEKTDIEEQRFMEYRELAIEPIDWAGIRWPPLIVWALGLIAVEVVLKTTRLRTLP
jgi:Ca-activated chloride channel family protein